LKRIIEGLLAIGQFPMITLLKMRAQHYPYILLCTIATSIAEGGGQKEGVETLV
jgi:hypothetical protein